MSYQLPEETLTTSADELLAASITTFFSKTAPWPNELALEARISQSGFTNKPPAPFGQPWKLETNEVWFAHGLGTFFIGLESRGNFKRAGAAAILITSRGLRLGLGIGAAKKTAERRVLHQENNHSASHQIEWFHFQFTELIEMSADDLMFLHFWHLQPLILRVPWRRSLIAFISGLRTIQALQQTLDYNTITDALSTFDPTSVNENKNH